MFFFDDLATLFTIFRKPKEHDIATSKIDVYNSHKRVPTGKDWRQPSSNDEKSAFVLETYAKIEGSISVLV